jgi:hypothetical protein
MISVVRTLLLFLLLQHQLEEVLLLAHHRWSLTACRSRRWTLSRLLILITWYWGWISSLRSDDGWGHHGCRLFHLITWIDVERRLVDKRWLQKLWSPDWHVAILALDLLVCRCSADDVLQALRLRYSTTIVSLGRHLSVLRVRGLTWRLDETQGILKQQVEIAVLLLVSEDGRNTLVHGFDAAVYTLLQELVCCFRVLGHGNTVAGAVVYGRDVDVIINRNLLYVVIFSCKCLLGSRGQNVLRANAVRLVVDCRRSCPVHSSIENEGRSYLVCFGRGLL